MVLWDTVSHDRREWYLLLAQWEWGAVSGTGVGMSTDEVLFSTVGSSDGTGDGLVYLLVDLMYLVRW